MAAKMMKKPQETVKDGAVYTRRQLEAMPIWRATFRCIIAHASPLDRYVCLLKKPGKEPGYLWKMPGMRSLEVVNLIRMQESLLAGRLQLVRGKLPRGIQMPETPKKKKDKS